MRAILTGILVACCVSVSFTDAAGEEPVGRDTIEALEKKLREEIAAYDRRAPGEILPAKEWRKIAQVFGLAIVTFPNGVSMIEDRYERFIGHGLLTAQIPPEEARMFTDARAVRRAFLFEDDGRKLAESRGPASEPAASPLRVGRAGRARAFPGSHP